VSRRDTRDREHIDVVMRASVSEAFGAVVRDRRAELHLTQQALADACGLHRNYIGGIERGERNPSLTQIVRLADGLALRSGELLSRLDERL
jgi:transcriptional regulator with XRE-family HTH domain